MALKTTVKVGRITNLSDARYCAGMGVDMLGFRVIPTDDHYVSPEKFQEFRGWFAGPQVVAEIYGLENAEQLTQIIKDYAPDLLECSSQELDIAVNAELPVILSKPESEALMVNDSYDQASRIEYMLITSSSLIENVEQIGKDFSLLIDWNSKAISSDLLLKNSSSIGVALSGSPEERPGLKSYEDLANILELLDVED